MAAKRVRIIRKIIGDYDSWNNDNIGRNRTVRESEWVGIYLDTSIDEIYGTVALECG